MKKQLRIGVSLLLCILLALGTIGCTAPKQTAAVNPNAEKYGFYEFPGLAFGSSMQEVLKTLGIKESEYTTYNSYQPDSDGSKTIILHKQVEAYGYSASVLLTFLNSDLLTKDNPNFDFSSGLSSVALRYSYDSDPAKIWENVKKDGNPEPAFPAFPTNWEGKEFFENEQYLDSNKAHDTLEWSSVSIADLKLSPAVEEEYLASINRSYPVMEGSTSRQEAYTNLKETPYAGSPTVIAISSHTYGYELKLDGTYAAALNLCIGRVGK